MHTIEPFYLWQNKYDSSNDELSPFYGRSYNFNELRNTIYNYYIHPEWDEFGSPSLYLKILFTDYKIGYSIIELMGEWNDCINNDIMFLKRNIIEYLISKNINKFILIGENILNFHYSDNCYYQEWFEEIEDGWIVGINFRKHVYEEFENINLDYYIAFKGEFDSINWRTLSPEQFYVIVNSIITKRLTN